MQGTKDRAAPSCTEGDAVMLKNTSLTIARRIAVLIVLAACCACSSGTPRVKPNPDPARLTPCPFCRGTGVIETASSVPPIKGVEMSPDEKETAEFATDITSDGWCLFNIFRWTDKSPRKERTEYELEISEKKERIEREEVMRDRPRGSHVKRMVKCHRCRGTGYIDLKEAPRSTLDEGEYNEAFKRANEMIDR